MRFGILASPGDETQGEMNDLVRSALAGLISYGGTSATFCKSEIKLCHDCNSQSRASRFTLLPGTCRQMKYAACPQGIRAELHPVHPAGVMMLESKGMGLAPRPRSLRTPQPKPLTWSPSVRGAISFNRASLLKLVAEHGELGQEPSAQSCPRRDAAPTCKGA